MSTGTRRNTGLAAVAVATAVAAVVTVLVSAAVAGQRFATREDAAASDSPTSHPSGSSGSPTIVYPTDKPPTSTVFTNGQLVIGDTAKNAYFEVPARSQGWEYRDSMILGLEVKDSYVGLLPKVFGAAYYDVDWCGSDSLPTGRAYFGLTGPVDTDDVQAANLKARDGWVAGLSFDLKKGDPRPRATTPRELTLADGTEAWVSSVEGRMSDGECASDKLKVTVLSIDSGANVATVVGHRYVGTGKDLSDAMVMKVLTSVRIVGK